MTNLIQHVTNSFKNAEKGRSKVTSEILAMGGMSGKKTRHFYNNICSLDDARYLEVGTWKGSSVCAAMCGNEMTVVAIDNWSEFGGPKEEFLGYFNKFKGTNNARFIESNCWDVDTSELGKFNIYMYDGNHTEDSHYQALNYFLDCLDDEFIYLVDDWNWQDVRVGTHDSIRQNNLTILWQEEIKLSLHNRTTMGEWWNGLAVFILKKNSN